MSNTILKHSLRFLFLFLFQVLVLKQVHLFMGSFNYISLIIYPLWLVLFPVQTPRWILAVSYTHLDVYKRQVLYADSFFYAIPYIGCGYIQ